MCCLELECYSFRSKVEFLDVKALVPIRFVNVTLIGSLQSEHSAGPCTTTFEQAASCSSEEARPNAEFTFKLEGSIWTFHVFGWKWILLSMIYS